MKVLSYVPGQAPQLTSVTFPSSATSATITFGTPPAGSWQWTQAGNASSLASDDSLNDYAQQLFSLLGRNADAQQAFLGKFMAGSALAGAAIGTAPVALQAGNELALGPATGRAVFNGPVSSAAQQATNMGVRVLGGTGSRVGSLYGSLSPYLPQVVSNAGWRLLSTAWAWGAAGTVPIFANKPYPAAGNLFGTEAPILLGNPNVFFPRFLP